MLYWIISMAMPASLTFSMDSWLMSAWLRSISARTLVVASMSSAEAWREDAGGMARHASTRALVSFLSFSSRSSMSWMVFTTRASSTGREVEPAGTGGTAR